MVVTYTFGFVYRFTDKSASLGGQYHVQSHYLQDEAGFSLRAGTRRFLAPYFELNRRLLSKDKSRIFNS
jgi:hypothetical protein